MFRQQSIQQQLDGTHDNLGDTIPMTTGTTTSQSQSQQQSQTTNPSNTVVVTASAGPSHSGSTSAGWMARPNQTNARPSRSNPQTNQEYVAALRDPYTGGLFADVELDMDIDFDFD